jgi:hypothetical protein
MLKLQEKIKLLPFSKVQSWFEQSKFVMWEQYAQVMYQAWLAGKNLVVYGKGGFGKSEMTYHFLELLATTIPDYSSDLLDCGGADSTKIWAGIKGSELPNFIYNAESSWLASRYVVFEELFDAQLSALVEMKQTLTSGEFRTPLQTFTSRCEWLVCLTNKSKAEVLDSVSEESRNTVDALLQRFPLAYRLQWSAAQLRDTGCWQDLLDKVKPYLDYQISSLYASALAQAHNKYKSSHDYMSPRSALHLLATTEAWAASTEQPLTLQHFLDTQWAYPEPMQMYFRDAETWWQEPIPPAPEPVFVAQDLDIDSMIEVLADLDTDSLGLHQMQLLDHKVKQLVYAFEDSDPQATACIQRMFGSRLNRWQDITKTTFVEA